MQTQGKLIVIEGLDGSGKATQAQLLYEALKERGVKARKVTFPDYESDSSALVKMYLSGQFGSKPEDVNAFAASAFFAVDRYASYKKDWGAFYRDGGIIVSDRYTTSNAVHQCSKLPKAQWDEYLNWLFHFEYDLMGIPAPDAVVYLKADVDASLMLMKRRYHNDEAKKDIHEKDIAYLRHSQAAAAYCAEKLGWKTVACLKNGSMDSIEAIHEAVERAIEGLLAH